MSDWEDAEWEDAEGWESESSPSSFLPQVAKDAIGGVDAAVSMGAGIPAYIGSGLYGLNEVLRGKGLEAAGEATKQFQDKHMPKPFTKEGGEVAGMLGTGVEALKRAGHGDNPALNSINDFATEMTMNLLPLPSAKGVRKLGGKVEEAFAKKPDELYKTPDGWEEAPAAVDETAPQGNGYLNEMDLAKVEQTRADNALQGELDLRAPDMPIDENGMPYNPRLSEDVQAMGRLDQADLFDEELRATVETNRANKDLAQKAAEEDIAYGQKMQEEALPKMVAQLQNKFHVPRSQRGAIDLKAFEGIFSKKALDSAQKLEPNETIVLMSPDEFHGIAEARTGDFQSSGARRAAIDSAIEKGGIDDIPYLKGVVDGGQFKVEAHNGRHRMDVLKERGLEQVPVKLRVWRGEGKPDGLPIRGQNIPKNQRGALDFQGIQEGLNKLIGGPIAKEVPAIQNIVGKNKIPMDPVPGDVVADALKEGKDTNSWGVTKYTASGATLESMARNSALVRGVSRLVQNAQKRADLYINKTVVPVENMFRALSVKEIQSLGETFKTEALNKERFTAEQLQERGMNEKQMRAYAGMRKLFENTMHIQNTARESLGLKPIDGKEYYFSSRWQGDFRQPIYDKEGKLKWYLADSSVRGLEKQLAKLKKDFPDLVAPKAKQHRIRIGRDKNDLQSMYTTMLDILGRDDPAVQKLREAFEESVASDTFATLGQKKHFEHKGNIRGFVGDRPGANSKKESMAMFQEQVQYAKNAYKWASLQEAGGKIKEVLSDEQLQAQQPKNVEYAKEYLKNNLGHGEAKWIAAMEDAFRETGVSPSVLDNAVGKAKSFFITQKLAINMGYSLANVMQSLNTIPHLVDIMKKHGGNPVTALGTGVFAGGAMGLGHYLNKLGGDFTKITKDMPFLEEAFKYAEDNGVTSRSVYDESPIDQRGMFNDALKIASKTMTIPETFVRSVAYMSYVQMLKDSGKFKSNMDIFQRAEELTNASMVDYRAGERPMVFSKAGIAGNALNTLQTYPVNLYNQYRYFGKEAMKGNVAPLVSLLALQWAMSGISGLPGFQDLDKLIDWSKDKVPDNVYKNVKDFDAKLWVLENLGESALYGALSDATGINWTSRLSAPGAADMIQAPGGPVMDIAKQVGSVAKAATSPNETTLAQAARDVAPTGLQGYLETGPLRDQNSVVNQETGQRIYKKSTDLQDRKGMVTRTPEEENIRKWGMRSQREVLEGDVNYKLNRIENSTRDRSKGVVEKYYDAVRRGDMTKAQDLSKLYIDLNGSEINDSYFEQQLLEEFTTAYQRKGVSTKEKVEALRGISRIKKIMETHD